MAVTCVLSHEHLPGDWRGNSAELRRLRVILVPATLLGASSSMAPDCIVISTPSVDPRRVSPPPPPTQRNQHEQHGPPPPHLQRYQPGAYGYTLPGPIPPSTRPRPETVLSLLHDGDEWRRSNLNPDAVYASYKCGPLAASTLRAGQGSAFFVRIFLCIRACAFFPPRPFRVLPFSDGLTLQLAAAWLACALHPSCLCIRARLWACLDGGGSVGCIGFDPHPRTFPFLTVLATSMSAAAAAARIGYNFHWCAHPSRFLYGFLSPEWEYDHEK
ncbi:hypothetical protein B0H16DRAFT_1700432, partial [Mycena metata]